MLNGTPYKYIYKRENKYYSLFEDIKDYKNLFQFFIDKSTVTGITLSDIDVLMLYINTDPPKNNIYDTVKNFIDNLTEKNYQTNLNISSFEEFTIDATLQQYHNGWEYIYSQSQKKYNSFLEKMKILDTLETSLTKEEVLSTLKYKNIKRVNVVDNFIDITLENSLYLFNRMEATEKIRFIRYNEYTKIYQKLDPLDDYIVSYDDYLYEGYENKILFRLKIKREYYNCSLDIENSIMTLSYPETASNGVAGDIYVEKELSKAYPGLQFQTTKEVDTEGTFDIKFPNYLDSKFYYLVQLNPIYKTFFFVKEVSKTRALKKTSKYYYKRPDFVSGDKEFDISLKIKAIDRRRIQINYFSTINNTDEIYNFAKNFSKLHSIYVQEEIFPIFKREEIKQRFITKRVKKKLLNLKTKDPNLFSKASKVCNCPKQPIIIDEEDVDDWLDYAEGIDEDERQVLLFPPSKSTQFPKNIYVCPDDKYPYPYLKARDKKNMVKNYPLIPCCRSSNYINTSQGREELEQYDEYRKNPEEYQKSIVTTGHIKKTYSKLAEGQVGILPDPILLFFKNIYGDSKDFKRLGVAKTNENSSIFATLLALSNFKYDETDEKISELLQKYKGGTEEQKIKYIKTLRRYLFVKIDEFNLVKQSLYDKTNLEIYNFIAEGFFDTRLFYKIIEHFFNINLVVFEYSNGKFRVELPRYKNFCIRNIRKDLPTICLYKQPHPINTYELIIGKGNLKDDIAPHGYIFVSGKEVYTSAYSGKINTEIEKLFLRHKHYVYTENHIYTNPYSRVPWDVILKDHRIISQRINDEGKTYTIDIMLDETRITLFTPPSEPLNIRLSRGRVYKSTKSLTERYFGKGKTGSNGLWYKINSLECLFIPCTDIGDSGREHVLYKLESERNHTETYLEKLQRIKREAQILVQLVIWCWRCGGSQPLKTWFTENVIVSEDKPGELVYAPQILNKVSSSRAAIEFLNIYWPTVFNKGKIFLTKKLISLIYTFMRRFIDSTEGSNIEPNQILKNTLSNIKDFDLRDYNYVFMNDYELDSFIKKEENENTIFTQPIEKKTIDPYFFIYNNIVYIIQNTDHGSLNRALKVCQVWKDEHKNIGYYDKRSLDNTDQKYIVYNSEDMKVLFSNVEYGDRYYSVLSTKDGNFCAMLKV